MTKKEEVVHGWTVERFRVTGELEVRFSKPNPDNPNRPHVCRAFVSEDSGADGESQAYDTGLRDALNSELDFCAASDRPAVEAALAEAQKTMVLNRTTRGILAGRVDINTEDGLARVITRMKNAGFTMMEALAILEPLATKEA